MQYTKQVRRVFSAAHTLPGGRTHGHSWWVTVIAQHELLDEESWLPLGVEDMDTHVTRVLGELDHRNLDELVGAVITTPTGLAGYLFERLAAFIPSLVRIDVWHENDGGSVSKT